MPVKIFKISWDTDRSLTDSVDDYVQINETIGIEYLERFGRSVNKIYLKLNT